MAVNGAASLAKPMRTTVPGVSMSSFTLVCPAVPSATPSLVCTFEANPASDATSNAYVGPACVETALVPSGEVRNPSRTVPRAILLAMVGITTLYVLLQLVSQGVLGATLATSKSAPLAEAAGVVFGGWGRGLLLAGATISTLGHNAGMTLAVPRALYAFGRDGYLPRPIAAVHPRYATPYVAIAVQSALVCLLGLIVRQAGTPAATPVSGHLFQRADDLELAGGFSGQPD